MHKNGYLLNFRSCILWQRIKAKKTLTPRWKNVYTSMAVGDKNKLSKNKACIYIYNEKALILKLKQLSILYKIGTNIFISLQ